MSGLLREVRELLSVRSRLYAAILDALHQAGIEIVFDNADQAETMEARRLTLRRTGEQIATLEAQLKTVEEAGERTRLDAAIAALREQERNLKEEVEAMAQRLDGGRKEDR